MWLKREHKKEALFYWSQANDFYDASKSLSNMASPLTLYYCFLNATKALLSAEGKEIKEHHGVGGGTSTNTASLNNEEIYFLHNGVLSGLCALLGEKCEGEKYTAKDILYNLVFVHRAYNLTFPSQTELFIPIKNPKFVKKEGSTEAWFSAEIIDRKYQTKHTINKIPSKFEQDIAFQDSFVIRAKKRFSWRSGKHEKNDNIDRLTKYHAKIRKDLHYIYGSNNLWYIKRSETTEHYIYRSSLTLTFALMHRLSELARYNPLLLSRHFDSQHNWLISEFISTSASQFIDGISSEITGQQFMPPGRRIV